nr:immunoglobulin heavy chain junction region [Mus musculus]
CARMGLYDGYYGLFDYW